MNRPTILSMWIFPLMAACSLVRIAPAINPTADWFETGERVSVREWDGKALEELPAFLFRQYLEKCKGTEIDGARRLIDYQILSVTNVGYLPEYILADVQYSVEPVRFLIPIGMRATESRGRETLGSETKSKRPPCSGEASGIY